MHVCSSKSVIGLTIIFWSIETMFASNFNNQIETENLVGDLVVKWAPLVWLAPGEKFLPTNVPNFLNHVTLNYTSRTLGSKRVRNPLADEYVFLTTQESVEKLLRNKSSFLYGDNPQVIPVPVYAAISPCPSQWDNQNIHDNNIDPLPFPVQNLHFQVTYWMFYPFNRGKTLCTVNPGKFGPLPIPLVFNKCLGEFREFGSHVGDWEHLSLYFEDANYPSYMYVSVHDAGAYYKFDRTNKIFKFKRQETRRGIIQEPTFPETVSLFKEHPIVFAANGSHGLWSMPGRHKYVKMPRLYDIVGYGTPWKTWENVEIVDASQRQHYWAQFRGRWGNEKSDCHPLARLGINLCTYFDGPTGIPMKEDHFICKN